VNYKNTVSVGTCSFLVQKYIRITEHVRTLTVRDHTIYSTKNAELDTTRYVERLRWSSAPACRYTLCHTYITCTGRPRHAHTA